MPRVVYGLCLVCIIVLLSGCNATSKSEKPVDETEAYPDFSENETTSDHVSKKEVAVAVTLKNTATYHTIEIKQMKFEPAELKLHKGDTVLWINKDITDHDVTEETEKKWTSSKLPMGKSWSMVAQESANYFCSIHMVMKGQLIVE